MSFEHKVYSFLVNNIAKLLSKITHSFQISKFSHPPTLFLYKLTARRHSICSSTGMKKFLAYTIPVVLSLAIGALGSYIQSPSLSSWYPTLIKSSLTPPSVVFPIAWTILYILMGLSIGRLVAQGDMSIVRLWLMQLLVNFLWSVSFFSLRSPLLGLIAILILVVLVFAYTIYAFSIDRIAGWLFVPYLLWLFFATYLTGYIYLNNPTTASLSTTDAPSYIDCL